MLVLLVRNIPKRIKLKLRSSLLVTLLFILPLLNACDEKINTANTTAFSAATATVSINNRKATNPVLRWLKGIPCHQPCWEGITPGRTTATEALELLRKNPSMKDVEKSNSSGRGEVNWKWVADDGFSKGYATFDVSRQTQIIQEIYPGFPGLEEKLSDLIEAFGEPDYVFAEVVYREQVSGNLKKASNYSISFLYLVQGMLFKSYLPNRGDFNPNLSLKNPVFFASTEGNLPAALQGITPNKIPWQGFKGFDFYCQDKDYCTDVEQRYPSPTPK